jgi:hypothetical protein
MGFCGLCGYSVQGGARFCGNCGNTVGGGSGGGRSPVLKSPSHSFAAVESCPGCGRSTASGEKVIVGGKEWHQACYNNSHRAPSRPVQQFYVAAERCPGCNGTIEPGMNKGDREKIIVSGKEWHKDCFDRTRGGSPAPVRQWAPSQERCPGCGDVVAVGMNTGEREKIIIGGKEWHKDCYDSSRGHSELPRPQPPRVSAAETCPGCGGSVAPGMNTGDREKIIVAGKEWHRDCYTGRGGGGHGGSGYGGSGGGGGYSSGGGSGFCPNCGTARGGGAFCSNCGTRL